MIASGLCESDLLSFSLKTVQSTCSTVAPLEGCMLGRVMFSRLSSGIDSPSTGHQESCDPLGDSRCAGALCSQALCLRKLGVLYALSALISSANSRLVRS